MDLDKVLIEEVRKRPLIYDLEHIDYKSIDKKERMWTEIAAKLNLNEDQCKKRWKGLRDTFKRCKKFELVAKNVKGAKTPRRKWRYYEQMLFLDNAKTSRNYSGWIDDFEDDNSMQEQKPIETASVTSASPIQQEYRTDVEENREREKKYEKFLELAAASISETCTAFVDRRNQQDSTALHFASLAAKIREANFPMSISNQIEAKVAELVFSEIEKYQDFLCEERD